MTGLTVKLDKKEKDPLYVQLYEYIKKEIISGQIEPETKLPSIRELSGYLNISKTTIETAYHQLYVEGYIESRPKSGYFVNKLEDNNIAANSKNQIFAEEAKLQDAPTKDEQDYRKYYIDKDSFDFALWRKYLNKALLIYNERFLTYGAYQGEYELRKEIAKYVHHSRGVICTPEQIIIGAGVQSLLNIICSILKPSYDTVGFEDPGFRQGRFIFRDHNFNLKPIKVDGDGINIKLLEESGAKVVYVSPSHQFPTGTIMPINKRIKLLNWAKKNNTLIIEDDYDSELRYFGKPIPSLQGLNEGANVVYLGTFSKILLPSLRISYMIMPMNLLEQYREKMSHYNQTSSIIEQIALSLFMKEGLLEKQIRKLRKIYARKNQILMDSIKKNMKNQVKVMGKESGLHILLEVHTDRPTQQIVEKSARIGVKLNPIANFYFDNDRPLNSEYPLVLLSYGGIPAESIEEVIQKLSELWFA